MSIFATAAPPYAAVLQARAGQVAMVRGFLATMTSGVLAAPRTSPHNPKYQQTTGS
jgi:hypothetical protein